MLAAKAFCPRPKGPQALSKARARAGEREQHLAMPRNLSRRVGQRSPPEADELNRRRVAEGA